MMPIDLIKLKEILEIVGAVAMALPPLVAALIGIALVIPGEQPEKALRAILEKLNAAVEVLKKFSRK